MKSQTDAERFRRYQDLLDVLMSKEAFHKIDIYKALNSERSAFIGKVIGELVRDGYLTQDGLKTKPQYSWSQRKEDFNVGRWIDQRVFTATVKRSPSADRPRERLLRLGPAELKTSELLAILVRAGVQGESAMQAGEKLSARFGEDLHQLSLKARGELKQITKAVGETAYCQVMAALELGKRLADQRQAGVESTPRITSTSAALAYCKRQFNRLAQEGAQEEFHVVLLGEKHQVIKTEKITVGLVNKSLAHPREVLKAAVREAASAIILVHNHPSGDPAPSQDDRTITKELKAAADILGIRIIDHIIVAKDKIVSMVEEKIF